MAMVGCGVIDLREFVVGVLHQASGVARRHFRRVEGTVKTHDRNQVLTEADLEIAALVAGAIDVQFPDHNRLDEELGPVDRGSAHTWVVDPIDGASNFSVGIPLYGVMIGLLEDGRARACGIVLPAFDTLYYAEHGCVVQRVAAACEGVRARQCARRLRNRRARRRCCPDARRVHDAGGDRGRRAQREIVE
jgi:fructose-1,6-bisphosphatase/inositol monophosphatase family enzyme